MYMSPGKVWSVHDAVLCRIWRKLFRAACAGSGRGISGSEMDSMFVFFSNHKKWTVYYSIYKNWTVCSIQNSYKS